MHPTPRPSRATAAAVALGLAVLGTTGCAATSGGDAVPTADPTGAPTVVASATPLPTFDPATTVGDYAPGFPVDLLGAPDDSTVLASSAVPQEDEMVKVSLNLATTLRTEQVVARLAERLEAAGFDESDPDALSSSDLTVFAAYTRTKGKKNPRLESVQLGVLDAGDERLVSVSGVVHSPAEG